MENNIVLIKNAELFVGTCDLAKGFEVQHKELKFIIDKYRSKFLELGILATQSPKPIGKKGGRPRDEYLLNEPQSAFLGTLLRNSTASVEFKLRLTKQFYKQRELLQKIALQKHNAEWIQKRDAGKLERRLETDTIKEFVEYAKAQGSQSADKYYMIISKMENQTLFALDFMDQKFPNLRDVLDGFALDYLKMADYAVSIALREGMRDNMHYKEIYQLAKQRVEGFALSMGKTPLRLIVKEQKLIKAPVEKVNVRISE